MLLRTIVVYNFRHFTLYSLIYALLRTYVIVFIEGPTHRAGNKLDLLFCNRPETISDVLTSPSNEHNFPTDHHIIEFSICTKFTRAKPVRRR